MIEQNAAWNEDIGEWQLVRFTRGTCIYACIKLFLVSGQNTKSRDLWTGKH